MDIKVSTASVAGLITEGILVILIPVILLIVWKKKSGGSLKPAIVGMVIFPVFGILLKLIPTYFLLIADNAVSRAFNSDIWLYSIVGGGLLAGIFEEGGRFFAFKLILKNSTSPKDAVSYGIGHGGFESAYLGINAFSYVLIALIVNSGNIELLTAGLSEADTAAVIAQVEGIAATSFFTPAVLGVIERISAIMFHISMSVFVYTAAKNKKYLWLFPTAIILHTLMNSAAGFIQTGMLSVIALEIIYVFYAGAMAFIAYKLYKTLEIE